MNIIRAHVDRAVLIDGGPIRFTASTAGRKKDGLDLRASRVDLTRFIDNPVILWSHDHSRPPIGRGEPRMVGEDVVIDVTFDTDDPFAADVDRKVRAGFISAGSVGLDLDSSPDRDGVADWTLTEFSIVPVPLDADALAQRSAIADALVRTDEHMGHVHVDTTDDTSSPNPEYIAAAFVAALTI